VCNHKKYFGNHPLESTSLLTIKQLFITLPTYELPTSLSNLCLNVQAVNAKEFYLLLYSITLRTISLPPLSICVADGAAQITVTTWFLFNYICTMTKHVL